MLDGYNSVRGRFADLLGAPNDTEEARTYVGGLRQPYAHGGGVHRE
jgi:hypothetical protein